MKKISLILVIAIILSAFTALAEGVIELPKVPLSASAVKVKLTSDADGTVPAGSVVSFNTEITPDETKGIKTATLSYVYSDSLEFNGDITLSGLPSGWRVSKYTDSNNVITFSLNNYSGNVSVKTTFSVKFSFTLSDDPASDLSVTFGTLEIVNGEGEIEKNVPKTYRNNSFKAKSVIPLFENLGASLRINNTPTIRFGMRVEKDEAFDEIFTSGSYSSDAGMKFGIVSINKNSLSGELSVDTKGARVKVLETVFTETSSEVVFVDTLESFPSNTTEYVFRPFVVYENGKGDTLYYYGDVKTRSAEFIASAELKSTVDETRIALLNKFID